MILSVYRCPVCGASLARRENCLKCPKGHSFDLASAGYVNLLTGGKKGAVPGDSKEMCASRHRFLSKGHYQILAQGLSRLLVQRLRAIRSPFLLDAACGEGYYTAAMRQALADAGVSPTVAGVDISKFALKYAGKRCPQIQFAAASIFQLPLPDESAHVVTEIFAPVAHQEFWRVLRPGGWMIIVGPGPRHLWQLKELLYEHPYENEDKPLRFPGFALEERLSLGERITLEETQDVLDLFAMTPYFWKTPRASALRLGRVERLPLEIAFEISVFRRLDNESENGDG